MPDNDIAQTTQSVGPDTEVDTSDDTSLEDMDVSWDDGDVTDSETETTDTTEEATEDVEEATDEPEADVEESDTPSEDSKPDEEPASESTAQQEKDHQANVERRIREREARQAKLIADQEKYLQEAEDASDQALRQLQVDAYQNRVMLVSNQLTADLNNVTSSIDLFNSKDPVIREAMLEAVDNFEALHVQKDEYGNPTRVTGDMRAYLQKEADRIRLLTGIGAKQQQQAKDTQKKRTLQQPSRAPQQPKRDDDMGFDAYINQY